MLLEQKTEPGQEESGNASGVVSLPVWMRLAPVAAVLLAFVLRLYRLGAGSLWYDETFSAYLAGLDLVSLTRHTAGDIHPPLYYYALHFWTGLAGKSEFALGFLSLFFGILLVAATYRLALRLFDRSVAAAAALLVAMSPFHLWYSQEVRMYTLAALLALASLWFALEAIDDGSLGRRRLWPWIGYAISSALGLYVLYYVAFALIALNLFVVGWWLLELRGRSGRSFFLRWLLAQLGAIILYLPWLFTALRQVASPAVPPWRHFLDLGQVLKESWSILSLGHSTDPADAWPFLLLFACLYALGLLAAAKSWGKLRALLLVAAVWGPVALIFVVSLFTPLFHARYVFVYSPLFYVTLSLGVVMVARFALALGLVNLLVVLGAFATSAQAYFHSDAYAPDDFRSAVRYVEDRWGPGDAVLLNAGYVYPAFLYYFPGEPAWRGRLSEYPRVSNPAGDGPVLVQMGSIDGDARLGGGDPGADFYAISRDEAARALEVLAERHQRLWLLRSYDTVTDPQGFVRTWLADKATLADDIMVQGPSNIRVQRYMLGSGRGAKPSGQPLVNFDNAIAMTSFEAYRPTVKSGETAFLRMGWLRQPDFTKDVRSYVALVDERGRVWQQQDNLPVGRLFSSAKWPAGAVLPDTWQFKIPPGTPPGDYRLLAGVYVATGGQTLEVRAADGRPLGPQANLGKLTVVANPDVVPPAGLARVRLDLGAGLAIADYELGTKRIKPGESLHVDLFWKALSPPGVDYVPSLSLRDRTGAIVSHQEGPPADGRYSTSKWQKGEVVRDQRDLLVDAGVPDGDYQLYLSVNGRDVALDSVRVRGRPRSYEVPKDITNRRSVRLGDSVELLGFDVEPMGSQADVLAGVRAGQKIRVVLYWRSLKRTETSYTVFTQLLDGGQIRGQRDRPPGDGALPTPSWLAGEVLIDAYEVEVKPDASAGELLLIIGMYDPKTGQRLAISDDAGRPLGDAYVLGKVAVSP